MPVNPRAVIVPRPDTAFDTRAADREEEERFDRWLTASDRIIRNHKDEAGWEEPPAGVLRRLRKRR